MQNERKRILAMLENGTITTDEALTLLEALGQSRPSEKLDEPVKPVTIVDNEQQSKEQDTRSYEKVDDDKKTRQNEHSMDDFLEDLRKDFTHVGDRFMQFMQTAVQKVKAFDFDSPFGQTLTFQQTLTKPSSGIEELLIDIDNGKVTIQQGHDEEIHADFTVKTYNSDSEEKAKKDFLEKLLFVNDDGKLRISSDLKMVQVNMDLTVPKKDFAKVSVRLLNGSFKWKEGSSEKLRVKTANGKIEISDLSFQNGEFETANGGISLLGITGNKVEAEAINGRVYIDGAVKDVEAQSLNGHVVVTTSDKAAEKIEAKTVSGSVEIYIPSDIALIGEIASNMGRLDLQLNDVNRTSEHEQLLQRSIRFKKDMESTTAPLHVLGEAKTGSVLVCYTATHQ